MIAQPIATLWFGIYFDKEGFIWHPRNKYSMQEVEEAIEEYQGRDLWYIEWHAQEGISDPVTLEVTYEITCVLTREITVYSWAQARRAIRNDEPDVRGEWNDVSTSVQVCDAFTREDVTHEIQP